jgi:hypothetical protein
MVYEQGGDRQLDGHKCKDTDELSDYLMQRIARAIAADEMAK